MVTLLAGGCATVILAYAIWQVYQLLIFRRLAFEVRGPGAEALTVAVVIPFRNEAGNLPALLPGLLSQTYPPERLTLIFVDDHSTDGSLQLLRTEVGELTNVRNEMPHNSGADAGAKKGGGAGAPHGQEPGFLPKVKILELADYLQGEAVVAHKKAALTYAISSVDVDVIVTMDADCQPATNLITSIAARFTDGVQAVCGPVFVGPFEGFTDYYQYLDLAAYQFLTAVSIQRGSPTLANGACFAFRRSAFEAVGGYAGVDHLPSGDDVLLLHKLTGRYSAGSFSFLAGGPLTITKPVIGWRALWRQRLRWAGKAGNYQSTYLQFAQYLTFFACLSCLLLLPLAWYLRSVALLTPWVIKAAVDYVNLRQTLAKLGVGQSIRMAWYLLTALIYPFFLVAIGLSTVIGLQADWKGRRN